MKVLLTAAHPDDTEFICGGTIASLVHRGDNVRYLVVTSGEGGLPRGARGYRLREAEQVDAAKMLGVSQTDFLRMTDGALEPTLQLRERITAVIRAFKPDLLITHSPDRNYGSIRFSHPDHLAVGAASLAAVYPDSRNERSFTHHLLDGLEPHVVPEVWLHGSERANFTIDITEHFENKIRAIYCHKSQLDEFGHDVEAFFRQWGEEVSASHKMPEGTLAEQYYCMDTK